MDKSIILLSKSLKYYSPLQESSSHFPLKEKDLQLNWAFHKIKQTFLMDIMWYKGHPNPSSLVFILPNFIP